MRNDEPSAPPLLTSSWPNMVPVMLLLVSEAIGKSNTYERLGSKNKKLKEVMSWDEEEDWFAPRKNWFWIKTEKKVIGPGGIALIP